MPQEWIRVRFLNLKAGLGERGILGLNDRALLTLALRHRLKPGSTRFILRQGFERGSSSNLDWRVFRQTMRA